jgi:uncharacterized protein YbjT (DUF2867 family)
MIHGRESRPKILLSGATGYIGGELLPQFERSGHSVRCMVRKPEAFFRNPASGIEVVHGDVMDPASLERAIEGVEAAYYLVHSMEHSKDFETLDRQGAMNFASAARKAGLRKIIYLGGLGGGGEALSTHLRSRQEVGEILRHSGVPVLEFRSSIVIGCGSFSFEMIRALVECLPVMITPRWVRIPTQPIAVSDLLSYLMLALKTEIFESRVIEIGGAEQTTYGELMREYARQRCLRRLMIPVPFLTPKLSSLWLALVTPYYARVGRKLVEGLLNATVIRDDSAQKLFSVRPMGLAEAIGRALEQEDAEFVQSGLAELLKKRRAQKRRTGIRIGTRVIDTYELRLACHRNQAFAPIQRIGGKTGWYYANWLYRIRGMLDRMAGGIGCRKTRRDPCEVQIGDILDFWKVEDFAPDQRLLLKAEMKLPGRAWLDFQVEEKDSSSVIRQTAIFDARGLLGLAYWQTLYPIHRLLFAGMLKGIGRAALKEPLRKEPS